MFQIRFIRVLLPWSEFGFMLYTHDRGCMGTNGTGRENGNYSGM